MTSSSGLNLHHIDPTVSPRDDLFGHANGRWIAETEIPADRGRYGSFDMLREKAEKHVHAIIEEVASGSPAAGTVAAKVGDLYASFMDEELIEDLGTGPLTADLERIRAIETPTDLMRTLGAFAREGVPGLVIPFVNTDDRDSTRYVVYLEQAGLGLPDESYYREERYAQVRDAYRSHLVRMLDLADQNDPEQVADRVIALETRLASAHWDTVTNRDPVRTYTLVDADGLAALTPGLDWHAYAEGVHAPADVLAAVVARQPTFLTAAAEAVSEEPISTWREWLTWHVLHARAAYLGSDIVAENFDFYGRTLSGVPENRERWKRGVSLVEGSIGEAVGELYVAKHFPPEAKDAMETLVANLVEAFRRSFASLSWMGEETRAAAVRKLEAFTPKVGYPGRWRDYSTLSIEADDLMGNVRRAAAFESDRNLGKLGGPVDRGEWFMTPQTVNAYYNPGMNEIVFPAAILQPPFFSVDADDAVNYGGIGAVIGHEIGHGFDDSGSRFDGDGNLVNWWTDEDRARFEELTGALIAQFSELEPRDAPGERINGALTVGENIGDLGGLDIGLAAYRIATGADEGLEPPVLDGLTGEQRFFLAWAQVWCGKTREAEAKRLLAIDPHSPIDQRANAVRNIDAFHEAFEVREGDGMWLAPKERVSVF
ncbi:M13 family metallopeptidase [Nostocoides sp. F2B08]|uniref:M13 family metallopeptidase n=1 Tax=Nostocoides sp. F2B08 TaxID=2653936 RepID=UPI001D05B818|nr:M13-type metalloendopeptidase [Tetrasphaera sp. F2B08]